MSLDVTLPPFDWALLERYLSGHASPDEAVVARQWLDEDPTRQMAVDAIAQFGMSKDLLQRDWKTSATWATLSTKLRQTAQPRAVPSLMSTARSVPKSGWPVTARATMGIFAAAVVVVMAIAARLSPVQAWWSGSRVAIQEYAAARGERATVTLGDGTRVVLGPESRIRVETSPRDHRTTVHLEGEAVFAVRHDPNRLFLVKSARVTTQDLGTTFAVRDYASDGLADVAVQTGSVSVNADAADIRATGQRVVPSELEEKLYANDVATVDQTGVLRTHRRVSVAPLIEWSQGTLTFDGTPLPEAVSELGRWYGIDLQVADAAMKKRVLTASFTAESANDALRIVADALGVVVLKRGEVMMLVPRGSEK